MLSQEIGQTSRGNNNISTRLAPRRTPILCSQFQRNFLLNKGKKRVQEGGLCQNPQKKNKEQTEKQKTIDYGNLK